MPSLDGVGRYYPLTLFAYADPGAAIPPPDIDAQDDWFAAAEEFLLSTLDQDVTFETITRRARQMAPAVATPIRFAAAMDMIAIDEGMVGACRDERLVCANCSLRCGNADHASVYAAASFWWTIGGDGYQPLAHCAAGACPIRSCSPRC